MVVGDQHPHPVGTSRRPPNGRTRRRRVRHRRVRGPAPDAHPAPRRARASSPARRPCRRTADAREAASVVVDDDLERVRERRAAAPRTRGAGVPSDVVHRLQDDAVRRHLDRRRQRRQFRRSPVHRRAARRPRSAQWPRGGRRPGRGSRAQAGAARRRLDARRRRLRGPVRPAPRASARPVRGRDPPAPEPPRPAWSARPAGDRARRGGHDAAVVAPPPAAVTRRSRERCRSSVQRAPVCTATPTWRARSASRRRSAEANSLLARRAGRPPAAPPARRGSVTGSVTVRTWRRRWPASVSTMPPWSTSTAT